MQAVARCTRAHSVTIHLGFAEDAGDSDRMRNVLVTGTPELSVVGKECDLQRQPHLLLGRRSQVACSPRKRAIVLCNRRRCLCAAQVAAAALLQGPAQAGNLLRNQIRVQ